LALAPRLVAAQCGNCDPGTYWGGVSDGAYRFDSSVSSNIQQAVFGADDAWGAHYHDQNNSNAILIRVEPLPPDVYGGYDANNNVLTIAQSVVDMCPNGCNFMDSVINHELGHSLGLDDIQSGCESSIMSWDRNRHVVTGPSSEDLCWWGMGGGGGGGGGECGEGPCVENDIAPGRGHEVDWRSGLFLVQNQAPARWEEPFGWVDLVALVRLTRDDALPDRLLRAEVQQVVGGWMIRGAIPSEIPIVRGTLLPQDGTVVLALKWDGPQGAFVPVALEIPTTSLSATLLRLAFRR
jgi:hypothetical protein